MKNIIKELADSKIDDFSAQLRGKIVMPADTDYDQERKVYNAMIDKHPGMIVKCVDVADVMAAVNFGRANNLLVAVRGGGHNGDDSDMKCSLNATVISEFQYLHRRCW